MKTPKHLWSGDWQAELEALREQRAAVGDRPRSGEEPAAEPEPEQERGSEPAEADGADAHAAPRRGPLYGFAAAAAVLAVAVAFLLGDALGGDSDERPAEPAQAKPTASEVYARASPAVASIRAGSHTGTAFLTDAQGTLVTSARVVGRLRTVAIRFGADGAAISGQVVGVDPASDLAVVRIDPAGIPSRAKPLVFANSDDVSVGDPVAVIGNLFGFDRTETAGVVSGVQRNVQVAGGFQISDAIQTDAAINTANSGGPLLNEAARVVGVSSQLEPVGTTPGDNSGVGFAVASNLAKQVVSILKEGGTIERPWLGVASVDASQLRGARVIQVVPGSPADAAGVRVGDLIIAIDQNTVAGSGELGQAIEDADVGGRTTLHVERRGRPLQLEVSLRLQPSDAS